MKVEPAQQQLEIPVEDNYHANLVVVNDGKTQRLDEFGKDHVTISERPAPNIFNIIPSETKADNPKVLELNAGEVDIVSIAYKEAVKNVLTGTPEHANLGRKLLAGVARAVRKASGYENIKIQNEYLRLRESLERVYKSEATQEDKNYWQSRSVSDTVVSSEELRGLISGEAAKRKVDEKIGAIRTPLETIDIAADQEIKLAIQAAVNGGEDEIKLLAKLYDRKLQATSSDKKGAVVGLQEVQRKVESFRIHRDQLQAFLDTNDTIIRIAYQGNINPIVATPDGFNHMALGAEVSKKYLDDVYRLRQTLGRIPLGKNVASAIGGTILIAGGLSLVALPNMVKGPASLLLPIAGPAIAGLLAGIRTRNSSTIEIGKQLNRDLETGDIEQRAGGNILQTVLNAGRRVRSSETYKKVYEDASLEDLSAALESKIPDEKRRALVEIAARRKAEIELKAIKPNRQRRLFTGLGRLGENEADFFSFFDDKLKKLTPNELSLLQLDAAKRKSEILDEVKLLERLIIKELNSDAIRAGAMTASGGLIVSFFKNGGMKLFDLGPKLEKLTLPNSGQVVPVPVGMTSRIEGNNLELLQNGNIVQTVPLTADGHAQFSQSIVDFYKAKGISIDANASALTISHTRQIVDSSVALGGHNIDLPHPDGTIYQVDANGNLFLSDGNNIVKVDLTDGKLDFSKRPELKSFFQSHGISVTEKSSTIVKNFELRGLDPIEAQKYNAELISTKDAYDGWGVKDIHTGEQVHDAWNHAIQAEVVKADGTIDHINNGEYSVGNGDKLVIHQGAGLEEFKRTGGVLNGKEYSPIHDYVEQRGNVQISDDEVKLWVSYKDANNTTQILVIDHNSKIPGIEVSADNKDVILSDQWAGKVERVGYTFVAEGQNAKENLTGTLNSLVNKDPIGGDISMQNSTYDFTLTPEITYDSVPVSEFAEIKTPIAGWGFFWPITSGENYNGLSDLTDKKNKEPKNADRWVDKVTTTLGEPPQRVSISPIPQNEIPIDAIELNPTGLGNPTNIPPVGQTSINAATLLDLPDITTIVNNTQPLGGQGNNNQPNTNLGNNPINVEGATKLSLNTGTIAGANSPVPTTPLNGGQKLAPEEYREIFGNEPDLRRNRSSIEGETGIPLVPSATTSLTPQTNIPINNEAQSNIQSKTASRHLPKNFTENQEAVINLRDDTYSMITEMENKLISNQKLSPNELSNIESLLDDISDAVSQLPEYNTDTQALNNWGMRLRNIVVANLGEDTSFVESLKQKQIDILSKADSAVAYINKRTQSNKRKYIEWLNPDVASISDLILEFEDSIALKTNIEDADKQKLEDFKQRLPSITNSAIQTTLARRLQILETYMSYLNNDTDYFYPSDPAIARDRRRDLQHARFEIYYDSRDPSYFPPVKETYRIVKASNTIMSDEMRKELIDLFNADVLSYSDLPSSLKARFRKTFLALNPNSRGIPSLEAKWASNLYETLTEQ